MPVGIETKDIINTKKKNQIIYYLYAERWLRGLKRTTRNRLTVKCSWVRIPPSPFNYQLPKDLKKIIEKKALTTQRVLIAKFIKDNINSRH